MRESTRRICGCGSLSYPLRALEKKKKKISDGDEWWIREREELKYSERVGTDDEKMDLFRIRGKHNGDTTLIYRKSKKVP